MGMMQGIASGVASQYERERQRVGAPKGTVAKISNQGNLADAPKFVFEGYPVRSSSSAAAKSAPATKSAPTKARPGKRVRTGLGPDAKTSDRTLLGN